MSGSGASVSGSTVTISRAGTYLVSGTLSDGQLLVSAASDDLVHLVLDGADITNTSGASLYASQCDKLVTTLADGTSNTLTDGGTSFAYNDPGNEEPNAALFSKDNLTLNGTGSLAVNASFNNGIGTKDDLVIVSGSLTVSAANHGVKGNDSVRVVGGELNVTAGADAIQTDNAEDTAKGWVLIEGGTLNLISAGDGIQADTALTITGGTFSIASGSSARGTGAASDSYKGLKSKGDILISGGSFDVRSYDDSVHANGSIAMLGGTFTLASADDGVHADANLTISGGEITVTQSYEGLEAANIFLEGGTVSVTAQDDGVNAAGGNGGSGGGGGGMFGRDNFSASGNYSINISGGSLYVLSASDGLDSNGAINMSGGTVVALTRATGDGGTGTVDANGEMTVTGGTLIYGGGATMNNLAGSSTQSYVYFTAPLSAGSEVSLRQNGQTLAAFTPNISCAVVAFSKPNMQTGQAYDLYVGSNQAATATSGTGGGSRMDGMGGGGMGGFGMGGGIGGGGTPPGRRK